jgi:hypothetical protein
MGPPRSLTHSAMSGLIFTGLGVVFLRHQGGSLIHAGHGQGQPHPRRSRRADR